jgi:hypothetical protein
MAPRPRLFLRSSICPRLPMVCAAAGTSLGATADGRAPLLRNTVAPASITTSGRVTSTPTAACAAADDPPKVFTGGRALDHALRLMLQRNGPNVGALRPSSCPPDCRGDRHPVVRDQAPLAAFVRSAPLLSRFCAKTIYPSSPPPAICRNGRGPAPDQRGDDPRDRRPSTLGGQPAVALCSVS